MKLYKSLFLAAFLIAGASYIYAQPSPVDQTLMAAVKDAEARKDWSEIRRIADSLLEKNNRNPQALYWKGYSQINTKDYKGAIETYLQLVNINPNMTAGWLNLGVSYTNVFDDKNAVGAYERALTLDPKNPLALQNLWTSNQTLGNREKAHEAYIRLKEIDPDRAQKVSLTHGVPSLPKKDEASQIEKIISRVETYIKTNPDDIKRAKEQTNTAEGLIREDKTALAIPVLEDSYKILEAALGAGSS